MPWEREEIGDGSPLESALNYENSCTRVKLTTVLMSPPL
jgi:hypothetical protein